MYARLNGTEYRVIGSGGWKLSSWDPDSRRDGFQPAGGGLYRRAIGPDETLDVIELRYDGTYYGIPVDVAPSLKGSLVLTTQDVRAGERGFEPAERSDWVLVVDPDARGLTVRPRRTPVAAPWLDGRAQRGGER